MALTHIIEGTLEDIIGDCGHVKLMAKATIIADMCNRLYRYTHHKGIRLNYKLHLVE